MAITSSFDSTKQTLNIQVEDQFDFSKHQDFKDTYVQHADKGTQYVIDLSRTSYMDSSALGMILLLREHANRCEGSLAITKPSDSVYRVLEIAQFPKLIEIQR